jgi:enamine deaminase RidA (YjgF/YER057c/UK114 family)
MSAEQRVAELGLHLPSPFPPVGSYVNHVLVGDLLVLGGQVPWEPPDRVVLGRLGEDLDVEQGREAARLAGLNALASIREALGTLDRVVRVVSLRGVVNATPTSRRTRRSSTQRPTSWWRCSVTPAATRGWRSACRRCPRTWRSRSS